MPLTQRGLGQLERQLIIGLGRLDLTAQLLQPGEIGGADDGGEMGFTQIVAGEAERLAGFLLRLGQVAAAGRRDRLLMGAVPQHDRALFGRREGRGRRLLFRHPTRQDIALGRNIGVQLLQFGAVTGRHRLRRLGDQVVGRRCGGHPRHQPAGDQADPQHRAQRLHGPRSIHRTISLIPATPKSRPERPYFSLWV